MLDWIDRLFKEHRFMRRFVVFWMLALLTGATYQVFWMYKTGMSAEYVALTGLLAVCFGFYQYLRDREGQ